MSSISKKIVKKIKFFLNVCGYDIQKIPKLSQEDTKAREMKGVLYLHENDVDIYQYAEKSNKQSVSFKNKLNNHTYKLFEYPCAICSSADFTVVAKSTEGFVWGVCKSCGLLQIKNRLSDTDINHFYESGEYQAICMGGLDDEKHFNLEYRIMSIYFIDIFNALSLLPQETRIIEIGCGSGGILCALKEWGAGSVKGYDIDAQRIKFGKAVISDIEVGDALSLGTDVYDDCNLVLLSNVLEHLSNPKEFLIKLSSQINSPNTQVVIDVPNLEYCYSYSNNSFIKFLHIGHLWYFNSITIERILNSAGFGVDRIFTRGAALTVVCSLRAANINNVNNGYWNSISSINHANYLKNSQAINAEIKKRMAVI